VLVTAATSAATSAAVVAAAASAAAAAAALLSSSCDEATSFEELASLAFHVCLKVDVRKDVEAGQGLVKVCICDRCDARVGGPPIGAEDEEGFDVGDQALGDLRAGGSVTACQPLLDEGHASLGLRHRVRAHLRRAFRR
jgi:hypothetical protein